MSTKIYSSDLRPGNIVKYENSIWRVFSQEHVKTGRGGAHMQIIFKNFFTDTKKDVRLNTENKLDLCSFESVEYVFSYECGDEIVCLDDSYNQINFAKRLIREDVKELILDDKVEDVSVMINILDGEVIEITLPKKAKVRVIDTEYYIKNQTANSSYKPAILKNNWKVMIPVFIEKDDQIIIDTENKEYTSKV